MGYVLKTERLRVVHRNERGVVTKRQSFRRGDKVSASDFQEKSRFDRLVEKGSLVDEEEFSGGSDANLYDPAVQGRGLGNSNATTKTTLDFSGGLPDGVVKNSDGSFTISGEKAEELAKAIEEGDLDDEESDNEDEGETSDPEPDYESMEYSDLQRQAKERTGDGSGGKDALIARLKGQDVIDRDADE